MKTPQRVPKKVATKPKEDAVKTFVSGAEVPRNHGKPWTLRQLWLLAELYAQKEPVLTWRSIAERLGRTIEACKFRMFVIRLAFFLMSDADDSDTIIKTTLRRSKA